MKRSKENGFSMIELMMVVAIMGFLVVMGAPQYQKFQMKAKQSEAKSLLSAMYTVQKAFYAEWTQYFSHFNALGYGLEGSLGYNVGFSADGGVGGPANHPTYRGITSVAAADRVAGEFCIASVIPGSTDKVCNTENTGVGTAETVPGTTITATGFLFGAIANLDSDTTTDRWTINQLKVFDNPSYDVED